MCLNKIANIVNASLTDKFKITPVAINAIDSWKPDFTNKTNKKANKSKKKAPNNTNYRKNQTAGLETILNVGINSIVMLLRNLDLASGLVNGALGKVTSITTYNGSNQLVSKIGVKFYHISEEVFIERFQADYERIVGQYESPNIT